MDVTILLAWVIPLSAIVGGSVGWGATQYWHVKEARKQAGEDADQTLKDKKQLFEELLSKTDDENQKAKCQKCIDDINTALIGLSTARIRRTLKEADLPPEDQLVVEGKNQLEPQQITELNKSIDEVSNLPQSDSMQELITLSSAYYYARQFQNAKKTIDRVVEIAPNDSHVLNNRGVICLKLNNLDEALTNFNKSLELNRNQPVTLNNRGNLYLIIGKNDEALADLNLSLKLRPDNFETLVNRGVVYLRINNYDKSYSDMMKALELNPDSSFVMFNLACLFSIQDKGDAAIFYLEKAIKLDLALKEKAKTDPDLNNIRNDPRFKKLVGV
jgi:Flp pilus assembly protein TadD